MDHASSRGEHPAGAPWRVGEWIVDPDAGQIARDGETVRVEARTMRLLLCLARRHGEVVSIDDLLGEVWAGVIVTPDSVYQAVTSLRRLLGDDPKQPTYIATVPKRGYRLMARVEMQSEARVPDVTAPATPVVATTPSGNAQATPVRRAARGRLLLIAVLLACAAGIYAFTRGHAAATVPTPSAKSIAVLAFLDLTDTMNEEPFADGMTEELITRLSKVPGLKVSAPRSSFYYKDKQVPVADIARSLGVTYILDGSVRSSGQTMRITARLVRAPDDFVIWSATYDRPLGDKLKVQDEIAGEVTGALTPAIQ